MLEYDRNDISEEIDINKTSASKKCDICHYWYFKDIGFKYELNLCNGCHDLMQKDMSFNDVAIVYVKGSAYRIHFWYMRKDDGISIMNNSNLIDKMSVNDLTYYQRNRDVIVNRAKDYYENDKERLRRKARDKCRNLSEEDKNKKKRIWKDQIPQYL